MPTFTFIFLAFRKTHWEVSWIILSPFVKTVDENTMHILLNGQMRSMPVFTKHCFFITSPNKPTKYLSCLLGDDDTVAALKPDPQTKDTHFFTKKSQYICLKGSLRMETQLNNLSTCGPNIILIRIKDVYVKYTSLGLISHLWEPIFLTSPPRWYWYSLNSEGDFVFTIQREQWWPTFLRFTHLQTFCSPFISTFIPINSEEKKENWFSTLAKEEREEGWWEIKVKINCQVMVCFLSSLKYSLTEM